MLRPLRTISIAFCVSLALPLAAQDFNWKENAKKHWESSYDFTYTVVNAMPAEAFGYIPPSTAKPTERNYGGLTMHIGVFNVGMAQLVTGLKGRFRKHHRQGADSGLFARDGSFRVECPG
jgi:hypothetical protein